METLSEYLDHLIGRVYVAVIRGRGYVSQRATEVSVRYYMESEVTGRAVPINDSADHFLLTNFHRLREEYLDRPLPVYEEPKPVSGEIPWREFNTLPSGKDQECYKRDEFGWWRCVECGHRPDDHYDPHSYECALCNCGNNSR